MPTTHSKLFGRLAIYKHTSYCMVGVALDCMVGVALDGISTFCSLSVLSKSLSCASVSVSRLLSRPSALSISPSSLGTCGEVLALVPREPSNFSSSRSSSAVLVALHSHHTPHITNHTPNTSQTTCHTYHKPHITNHISHISHKAIKLTYLTLGNYARSLQKI